MCTAFIHTFIHTFQKPNPVRSDSNMAATWPWFKCCVIQDFLKPFNNSPFKSLWKCNPAKYKINVTFCEFCLAPHKKMFESLLCQNPVVQKSLPVKLKMLNEFDSTFWFRYHTSGVLSSNLLIPDDCWNGFFFSEHFMQNFFKLQIKIKWSYLNTHLLAQGKCYLCDEFGTVKLYSVTIKWSPVGLYLARKCETQQTCKQTNPIDLYHTVAILSPRRTKSFVLPVQPHTEWEVRRAKSFVSALVDKGLLQVILVMQIIIVL